ncbi:MULTISPECIES: FxsA family protein [unclassified Geodermatophilus]
MGRAAGRRVRLLAGLWALAEIAVFVLVASWIGVGATVLAALATTVLGWALLARQMKDLAALHRSQARGGTLQRGLTASDAGLVAVGGVLMVLPGFLGDLVGLLCLLPVTRPLVRAAVGRGIAARLGLVPAGPVRVRSARVPGATIPRPSGATRVIEGEVAGDVVDTGPRG